MSFVKPLRLFQEAMKRERKVPLQKTQATIRFKNYQETCAMIPSPNNMEWERGRGFVLIYNHFFKECLKHYAHLDLHSDVQVKTRNTFFAMLRMLHFLLN